ncbi:hypothetical protein C5C02_05960 [Rathayibacter rathayi]|nr:hypothetical protein C5C02_05960 [Rathayibacter rathayi]
MLRDQLEEPLRLALLAVAGDDDRSSGAQGEQYLVDRDVERERGLEQACVAAAEPQDALDLPPHPTRDGAVADHRPLRIPGGTRREDHVGERLRVAGDEVGDRIGPLEVDDVAGETRRRTCAGPDESGERGRVGDDARSALHGPGGVERDERGPRHQDAEDGRDHLGAAVHINRDDRLGTRAEVVSENAGDARGHRQQRAVVDRAVAVDHGDRGRGVLRAGEDHVDDVRVGHAAPCVVARVQQGALGVVQEPVRAQRAVGCLHGGGQERDESARVSGELEAIGAAAHEDSQGALIQLALGHDLEVGRGPYPTRARDAFAAVRVEHDVDPRRRERGAAESGAQRAGDGVGVDVLSGPLSAKRIVEAAQEGVDRHVAVDGRTQRHDRRAHFDRLRVAATGDREPHGVSSSAAGGRRVGADEPGERACATQTVALGEHRQGADQLGREVDGDTPDAARGTLD